MSPYSGVKPQTLLQLSKPRRVKVKQTGEVGTITKTIGRCWFIHLDNGTNISGARQYFKVIK